MRELVNLAENLANHCRCVKLEMKESLVVCYRCDEVVCLELDTFINR